MASQGVQVLGVEVLRTSESCARCGEKPGWYRIHGDLDRGRIRAQCLCVASDRFKLPQTELYRMASQHD